MMRMVFYRCQAIHISCPLQIAKNIAIWPHLGYTYTMAQYKIETLVMIFDFTQQKKETMFRVENKFL